MDTPDGIGDAAPSSLAVWLDSIVADDIGGTDGDDNRLDM